MGYTFRPLGHWPRESTPRYNRRSHATFRAAWSDTLWELESELDKIGARNVVIQADFRDGDIRLDGLPKANARVPEHPGVIVSFDSPYGPLQYMTDEHANWQHNVRAIALGLKALRAVDRYGITKTGEQYTGWKALPTGSGITTREAAAELIGRLSGVAPTDDDGWRTAYRAAIKKAHPDGGGDADTFQKVQDAGKLLGITR